MAKSRTGRPNQAKKLQNFTKNLRDEFRKSKDSEVIKKEIDGLLLERDFIMTKLPDTINLGMFTVKLKSIKSELISKIQISVEQFQQIYTKNLDLMNQQCYQLYQNIRDKLCFKPDKSI